VRYTIFFYIFVPRDFDLWPLELKFVPLVSFVQRHVSTKLEVSTALLLRENRKHRTDRQRDGRTDGVQHLMLPPTEGRVIIQYRNDIMAKV